MIGCPGRLPRLRLRQEGRGDRQRPRGAAAQVEGRSHLPVADEVITGALDEDFPLYVCRPVGTQSNMNTTSDQQPGHPTRRRDVGSKTPVHPNDHAIWPSSNDTFPTAMHIAAVTQVQEQLLRSAALQSGVRSQIRGMDGCGQDRPHPPTGRRYRSPSDRNGPGYAHQLAQAIERVHDSSLGLYELAVGVPPSHRPQRTRRVRCLVAAEIAGLTGLPVHHRGQQFSALGGLDAMVGASAG